MTHALRNATATVTATVGLALLATGCQLGEPEELIESTQQATTMENGTWVNTTVANGTWVNTAVTNGTWVNGTWVNGTWVNGTWVNGVTIDGTVFKSSSGLSGDDFVGAYMHGVDDNGNSIQMKIFDMKTAPDPTPYWVYYYGKWVNFSVNENADIKMYTIKYKKYYRGYYYWTSICRGSNYYAIPIAGRWNYDSGYAGAGGKTSSSTKYVTFDCYDPTDMGADYNGAIAKCVFNGYKPWHSWKQNKNHQACVRMVRADYCGDGNAWTQTGTTINVYDPSGINTDTAPYWAFEARWSRYGATCMDKARGDAWNPYMATTVQYYAKTHTYCPTHLFVTHQSYCNGDDREYNVVTERP